MPRPLRRTQPGRLYHLISRFTAREWFITGDEERQTYLRLLGDFLPTSDWRLIAYAVMSNHIHLLAVAGLTPLASWLRETHSLFAEWMNHRRDRIGAVFVKGPKDFLVTPENVEATLAYIHNNPVRAGVVRTAAASSWTSHRAYIGLAKIPTWLDANTGFELLGVDDASDFDGLVNAFARTPRHPDPTTLFARELAARLVSVVADELGLEIEQLCTRTRLSEVVTARRVVVHGARQLGVADAAIAARLGISHQAVSMIRRRDLDSELEELCTSVLKKVA